MIFLRHYQADDAQKLLALFRDTIRRVNCRDYDPQQIAAWSSEEIDVNRWAERFCGHFRLVAEAGNIPVGFAELEAGGNIGRVYVSADYQRLGIGKRLLEAIIAKARRIGLPHLDIEASITAKPFFESLGFILVAPQTVTCRGAEFLNYRMVRMF